MSFPTTQTTPTGRAVMARRMSVRLEGDFVVYLVGMRINRPWKLHRWLPPFLAMRPMLRALSRHPELGCLGFQRIGTLAFIQYWRSEADLRVFARASDGPHLPAWTAFNRRIRQSRGDVGLWHELYRVGAGAYSAVYSGMPPFGLGRAGHLIDLADRAGPAMPDPATEPAPAPGRPAG